MIKYKNQDINEINIGLADPVLEDKTVEITENGTTNVKASPEADGLGNVTINANIAGGSVEVIDNLTSSSTTSALSANQGKILNETKADKTEIPDVTGKLDKSVYDSEKVDFVTKKELPTKTSQLTNDSGFLTGHQDISGKLDKSVYEADKPTFVTNEQLNAKGYLTEIPTEYVTETELTQKGYLTEHQDISGKLDKSVYDSEKANFATKDDLTSKQDTLNSGVNIKTINNQSILGEGNIVIEGGSGGGVGQVDTTPEAANHGEIFNDYAWNKATGLNSHAEGMGTTSSGGYGSHAEGFHAVAEGSGSHAEGNYTTASGYGSHAEGNYTTAENYGQHSQGRFNTTDQTPSPHEYDPTKTLFSIGNGTEYELSDALKMLGNGTMWISGVGDYDGTNPTESNSLQAVIKAGSGGGGSGGGVGKPGTGLYSEIFNKYDTNTAEGESSHAEGYHNNVIGNYSHVEGLWNEIYAVGAHAEGNYNRVPEGDYSHVEGWGTLSEASCGHAEGWNTVAENYVLHSQGCFNTREAEPSKTKYDATKILFSIGNGTYDYSLGETRSDALKMTGEGNMWILGALNEHAADYAEMFEWLDSNPNAEDRVGYFVTLNGEKIVKATSKDNYTLGIVSATPAVIGDNPNLWHGQYINDEWGRPIYEDKEVKYMERKINENGEIVEVEKTRIDHIRKINPEWDASTPYKDRTERKEWSAIGLVGKLLVRQDGTLTAGSYCKPNDEGIATKSDTGYYVMRVNNKNQALVLFK